MSKLTKISDLFSSVVKNTPAVGASIVAGTSSDIYFEKSFGVVHASSDIPISSMTLFDIQSITKVVATAGLLEQFILTGKISLDDNIQKFLPELTGKHKSEIRIRHLLLHQSGISDEDFSGPYRSPEDLWTSMFSTPLRSPPEILLEYTDVGYRLLGLCLERLGGGDLDQLCKKHFWLPLGMQNTSYHTHLLTKEMIAGHGSSWGVVDDTQDRLLAKPLGCDGVFSSTKDLISFCRYWLNKLSNPARLHELLNTSAGSIDHRWSPYESLGLGKKTFGWEQHHKNQSYIGSNHTNLTLEKAGGAGAFVCIRPERQDFFIYLTNHGRPDPFSMESWNDLVANLKVREIAEEVIRS